MKKTIIIIIAFIISTKINAQIFQQSFNYDTTIIGAFRQGLNGDYNCASIALIKCAITTFGVANVFKSKIDNGSNYGITLRNGDSVNLTKQELANATEKSGFKLGDNENILNQAYLMYAVMAKRTVDISNSNSSFAFCTNLDSALKLLHGDTGGIDARKLPTLLGLGQIKVRHKRGLSYIYENGYHAVFASENIFDNYGSPDKLTIRYWKKHIGLNPYKDIESINFKLVDISQQ